MVKQILAKTKYVNVTARKARLVADLIRGKKAIDGLDIIRFSRKAAGEYVGKTLKSAIANATNNFGMDKKELMIVSVLVNDAPIFKRGRAISRGRYHKILKRNCHITIAVSDMKEIKEDSEKKDIKPVVSKSEKVVENKVIKKTTKKSIKKSIKK